MLKKQNRQKSNLIGSKSIIHLDTDAAAAGAAVASAAATVATTIKMVVKTKATAEAAAAPAAASASYDLNEKLILIPFNLVLIDFVCLQTFLS